MENTTAYEMAETFSTHQSTIVRRLKRLGFKTPKANQGTIEPWVTQEMWEEYYKNYTPPPGGKPYPEAKNYLIYKDGRVWSKSDAKFRKQNTINGYFYIAIRINGKSKMKSVGDLVLTTYDKPRPKGYEVNHLGKRTDNRIEMLEWVTPEENILHAKVTNRVKGGGKPRTTNKDLPKGICRRGTRYTVNRFQIYLGMRETLEEAKKLYNNPESQVDKLSKLAYTKLCLVPEEKFKEKETIYIKNWRELC